ncbi:MULTISPECIES: aromatic amino acid ammonia-lyase [unclassified Modicisalibacter]|uniref:HAL/PAL/TAL family ammonia-lyase n=1 Tax=unclassified Modicisalibacter TaxID=2679913 RepID=UPI001CCFEE89|nr:MULTISPECIES: aromatic amino acid ammonia-lyase [unclassified Modicisalibacter]MBZ9559934.1 aromatic amino acid lyase [Modicisalibacter sp. R2A 31.J]MBZ9575842.1 aromatic amino acid lyase [Modicisalibacter sp. MOD 31.J]
MNADDYSLPWLTLDGFPVPLEAVERVARRECRVRLTDGPDFRRRIEAGPAFLDRLLDEDGVVYGVTTGYGDACTRPVPADQLEALPHHLYTFHGCGLGEVLDIEAARAVVFTRLVSLCRGVSGVSWALLERLVWLLEEDVVPIVPSEGSVGASGDLTPLSYLAAVLCGEREVFDRGRRRDTAEAMAERGLAAYRLRPKEGLALMNGTAVMTALACQAWGRAERLSRLATRVTAMNVWALDGNPYHFDAALFAAKPHPGQQRVAARLRRDLAAADGEPRAPRNSPRLQDRYSTRCAPHVIGVLEDSLGWLRGFIEGELNSANDNPLIDPDGETVMHGGHFYGGHIAFAMDSLKTLVANLADLLDRQLALLVDGRYNHGLPANLSGAETERAPLNHGYKAVQIGVSAWAAEALKQTMPASVFSRSTECHNQDKVSMGTIAARDALRVLTLTEQVVAGTLHAACQAVELRQALNGEPPPALGEFLATCREQVAGVGEDRALEADLRRLCRAMTLLAAPLYADASTA